MYVGSTAGVLALPSSNPNQILTLTLVSPDCNQQPRVVARSHSGFGWERLPPFPNPAQPVCIGTSCTLSTEHLGGGGGYRVDAHDRPAEETPTESESTARLLLQGTFGTCALAAAAAAADRA